MKKESPNGETPDTNGKNTTPQDKMYRLPEKAKELLKNSPPIHNSPIFTPKSRKHERQRGIRVIKKFEGGAKLEIRIFNELDISDQDLFLTLLVMASDPQQEKVYQDSDKLQNMKIDLQGEVKRTTNSIQKIVTKKFDYQKQKEIYKQEQKTVPNAYKLSEIPAIEIKATRNEIIGRLGKGVGNRQYKWLQESLKRLAGVNIYFEGEYGGGSFHLLSFSHYAKTDDRKYHIRINPLSALPLLANDVRYIGVDLKNRSQLKSETAKAVHYYLSGAVRKKEQLKLYIDTIVQYIYPVYHITEKKKLEELTAKKIADRRLYVKKALKEIDEILPNWHIKIAGRGKDAYATISRDKPITPDKQKGLFD